MRPAHITKGYSPAQQRTIINRTIKALTDAGFAKLDTYFRIRVGDLYLIVQPPVLGANSSWHILCFKETDECPHPWIGGGGTLTFSAKWATPGKVFHSALCQLYNKGYALGVADVRNGVKIEVAEFVKRIETKL